jgi:hypothetical protein
MAKRTRRGTIDKPEVLATAYSHSGGALIVLASWSAQDELVNVTASLSSLGIEGNVRVHAPLVEGLQEAAEVDLAAVSVPAGQGLFVLVETMGGRQ